MDKVLNVLLTSILSVFVLFIIAKILGKKQVAQLEFIDYIIGISIGSIAAEMSTDTSQEPFYYYIIAMAIYMIFDILLNFLSQSTPKLKHFFKGRPLTIIYEGKIDYKTLKKARLDVNDLLALARSEGYFEIKDIAYAVFENNGKLSILPKGNARPTIAEDLNIKTKQSSLPVHLIVDGVISKSSLTKLQKDKTWLFKKININNKKELKNILLATYDVENDEIEISRKK